VSLDHVRKLYLAHCRQTLDPVTVVGYQRWLNTILSALAVTKVSQLALPAITLYRQQRLALGKSPRTVNGEVGALRTMLQWAVDPARLIGSNPLAGVKPLPHLQPKQGRALSDDEVKKLLDASPPHWREIWYAFLTTGMRKGELAALQFSPEFIDWEGRDLIVPAWLAKSCKARHIPMNDELVAIIKRREAERSDRKPASGRGPESRQMRARFTTDHIFTTRFSTPLDSKGNLLRALEVCLRRAGIERKTYHRDGRVVEHLDVHSLRRTFATSLIVGGADPKSVQELLGHATLAMTMQVYTKVRAQTKRQAIAKLTYGGMATGPDHVLPISGAKCRPGVTNSKMEPQGKAE
jgi:integrase